VGGHARRVGPRGGGARGCGGLWARSGVRAGLAVGGHAVGQRGAGQRPRRRAQRGRGGPVRWDAVRAGVRGRQGAAGGRAGV